MTHPQKEAAGCTAFEALGREYDHYDQDFAFDPHATYTALREKCPVAHTTNYEGFWVLSRFEDIAAVLNDPSAFSSFPADTPPTPGHKARLIPFEVDPPEHRRYRALVDPLFRPKIIDSVQDRVRGYAAELVDVMVAKGEFDFVREFAEPFPSSVFLQLIGFDVTPAVRDQLIGWTGTILHTTTEGAQAGDVEAQRAARIAAGKELNRFLRAVVEDREANRGQDLVSRLIDAEWGGERKLEHGEIINFVYVLVLAGLDTVTSALAFSFLHLARRPDLQDRLAADPALIPNAVDEMLRFEAIVHASRTVVEPRVINGVQLSVGDRLVVPLAAAHRDPEAYERADEIDFDRPAQKSMVFGAGNHRCLGSYLARRELIIGFEEILKRIPTFSLADDAQLVSYGGQTRSLANLPLRVWR